MPNTSNFSFPYPQASDSFDVPRDVGALAIAADTTIKSFRDTYDAYVANPAFRNVLINGAFDIWQRGTASTSSPAGSRTFLADRWYVNPAGAAVTQQRSTTVPSPGRSDYSLQITGATSVTTVNIGQRIEMLNTPQLKRTVTFSARIFNNTGGAFVPSLLIGTPAAADDFTTVTNRLTQTLQSCANNAWTTVSHTVDISGYTNFDNGLQVEIQIPSGSLNTGSKIVNITEVQLEAGSVATPFERRHVGHELMLCQRYFERLTTYPGGGGYYNTTSVFFPWMFKVTKRGTPQFSVSSLSDWVIYAQSAGIALNSVTYENSDRLDGVTIRVATSSITQGSAALMYPLAATAWFAANAEL